MTTNHRKGVLPAAGATILLLAACVSLRPYSDVASSLPPAELLGLDLPWGRQRVHVQQSGAAGGEALVLLHGFGASSHAWRLVAPQLGGVFRLIAPDLSGFGYTERPRNPTAYTLDGQTRLLLAALDALGVGSAHFAGHSYGGGLAAWIARHHPERVRSLVLLDSASPDYAEDRRTPAASITTLVRLSVRGKYLKKRYVRRALERNVFDDSLVTDALVRAYADRLRVEGVVRAYQGLTAPRPAGDPPPARFDFSAVEQRTLVIWGAHDETTPVAGAKADLDRLPNAHLMVLPHCGHIPMEEKPAETAAAMLRFLTATS